MTKVEKVLYALLYSFVYLMSLLPFCVLYLLSDFIFFIMYHWVGYRKNIVKKNLRESFPEKSDEELLQIEKKFYHFLCDYIFETIKLMSISKEKMKHHVHFEGLNYIQEALNQGHNVALYLAHYGNWEWMTSMGLYLPNDLFLGQVYHVLENKVFDRLMLKLRSRCGSVNIERHVLLRKVAQVRHDGIPMVIGFISDQGPEMHTIHHWLPFQNHDTAVITGTEAVSKKFDFTCVYLDVQRPRRGYYTVDIKMLTTTPTDYKDFDITEMYFKELETSIRRQPEIWLWTHNRWKRTRQQYEEYIATHSNARKS